MFEDSAKSPVKYAAGLAYREGAQSVDANAPTLVFLHGNSFSSSVFEEQLLSDVYRGFRLIAFDLPGHGASMNFGSARPYNFENFGLAVLGAIQELNLTHVTLAGWSLGGHIALDILDRSEAIKSAAIFGAPPMHRGALSTIWAYHFTFEMLLASKRHFTSIDAARFESLCVGALADGRHIKALMIVDPVMRGSLAKSVMNGDNNDQYKLATSTQKPLLIIHGENDPLVRTSFMNSFASSVDFRGEYAVMENSGHAPFIDQADMFSMKLKAFADKVNDIEMAQNTHSVAA